MLFRRAVRFLVVSLFLGTAALTGVVVAATPASACSCAFASAGPGGQDAEPAAGATTVVVGTIVDRYLPPPGPVISSQDPAVWTVQVETVLKGSAVALERVVTPGYEASCGGLGIGLDVNRRAVLFLRAQNPPVLGARYASSLCSGGRLVSSAADVSFPGAVASSPSPGGSIPERATPSASAPTSGSEAYSSRVSVVLDRDRTPVIVLGAAVALLVGVAAAVAVRTRRR